VSLQWWRVACLLCRWQNTRCGSHEDVTRNTCPRCGGAVTAAMTVRAVPRTILFRQDGT
jgi:hypothetical protein